MIQRDIVVVKLITVHVKRGHQEQYLAAQKIWNRETRAAPGYLGGFCGCGSPESDTVHLVFFWRSRAELDEWMARDHDRIASLAKADEHYERIETQVLDAALPITTLPSAVLPENTFEAADVQSWNEAYRATAALRTALRLGLFERLSSGPRALPDVAAALNADADLLKHLLRALCAMGLVVQQADGWTNTDLAARTLVESSPAYQGERGMAFAAPGLRGLPDHDGGVRRRSRWARQCAPSGNQAMKPCRLAG